MLETHKVNFQGIAEIKAQIKLIQSLLGQTYEEINKLSNMGITLGIEHSDGQHQENQQRDNQETRNN